MSGSVEALEDALLKLDVGDEVELRVIHRGVGAITENDVNLASGLATRSSSGSTSARRARRAELAEREGVDIRYYSVIYQAIDEIEAGAQGHAQADLRGGRARPRRDPRRSSGPRKVGNIAGCMVRSGTIRRNSKARLHARRRRRGREPRRSTRCGASRTTPPRSARATSAVSALGSFNDIKDRRRHRNLRDAGEAAVGMYAGVMSVDLLLTSRSLQSEAVRGPALGRPSCEGNSR
ncbi:MAG: hypothetical protein V9G10_17005 [Candidatus Nanopelagicales bacterium]